MEKIQERAVRILYNDCTSDYNQLLNKSRKAAMEVKLLSYLALEIFKILKHLNPKHMEDLFHKTAILTRKPLDIKINQNNTTKYGNKSTKTVGLGIPF